MLFHIINFKLPDDNRLLQHKPHSIFVRLGADQVRNVFHIRN